MTSLPLASDAPLPQIVIVGGGGHARALIDSLRASGNTSTIAVLDADIELRGRYVLDALVVGDDSALVSLVEGGATEFAVAVGAGVRGDNRPRRRLFERTLRSGLRPATVVHPSAIISRWATVGAGAQIFAGAVINAGARIGRNTIVNSSAIIEHDCIVGDHVHIASGACLASAVTVGDEAHIGSNATVRQTIAIGERAAVGIGAAVIRDVPPSTVVVGVPARILRRL